MPRTFGRQKFVRIVVRFVLGSGNTLEELKQLGIRQYWVPVNVGEKILWHGKFLDEVWICAAARCGVHVGSALK